jgi:ATP-dependent DNA ligase
VHELKHDGYRLQIHVRDGRVRLYDEWRRLVKALPRIVEEAARIKGSAVMDAEVVYPPFRAPEDPNRPPLVGV